MDIRIRVAESDDAQPLLLWDSEWNPAKMQADWVLSGPGSALNPMGLRAEHALHTAVVLALFTWRRSEKYEETPAGNGDQKGWWGDSIDLQGNETFIGSKLWLLFRSVLDEKVRRKAIDYCHQALHVLVQQKAVSKVTVEAEMEQIKGVLALSIRLFSQDGRTVYDQKFEIVWRQEFRK